MDGQFQTVIKFVEQTAIPQTGDALIFAFVLVAIAALCISASVIYIKKRKLACEGAHSNSTIKDSKTLTLIAITALVAVFCCILAGKSIANAQNEASFTPEVNAVVSENGEVKIDDATLEFSNEQHVKYFSVEYVDEDEPLEGVNWTISVDGEELYSGEIPQSDEVDMDLQGPHTISFKTDVDAETAKSLIGKEVAVVSFAVTNTYNLETNNHGQWFVEGEAEPVTSVEMIALNPPVPHPDNGVIIYNDIEGQHKLIPTPAADYKYSICEYNDANQTFTAYFVNEQFQSLTVDGYHYLPLPKGDSDLLFYDIKGNLLSQSPLSDLKSAAYYSGTSKFAGVRSINNVAFDTVYPEDPKTGGPKGFRYDSQWAKDHIILDSDGWHIETLTPLGDFSSNPQIGVLGGKIGIKDVYEAYNPMSEGDPNGFGGQWGNFLSALADSSVAAHLYSASFGSWGFTMRSLAQDMCVCVLRAFNSDNTTYYLTTSDPEHSHWIDTGTKLTTSFFKLPDDVEYPPGPDAPGKTEFTYFDNFDVPYTLKLVIDEGYYLSGNIEYNEATHTYSATILPVTP